MRFLVSVAFVSALVACGSPTAPVIPFTDAAGRSCNYDTASTASPPVTCDVDPRTLVTCTSPAVPSYIVITLTDTRMPFRYNCAACRTDHLYEPDEATCSVVECDTASDCPMSNDLCSGGRCQRDF